MQGCYLSTRLLLLMGTDAAVIEDKAFIAYFCVYILLDISFCLLILVNYFKRDVFSFSLVKNIENLLALLCSYHYQIKTTTNKKLFSDS